MSDYYKAKIGLFMGSFNPPHIGHREAVLKALSSGMNRVWVVPSMWNPWKSEKPVNIEHRFWMTHYEMAGIEDANVMMVITDPDENGKYYSVDQLRKILRGYGARNFEFWIIGGEDVTEEIEKWKEGDWILGNFKTLTIPRPGLSAESSGTCISSTEVRRMLLAGEDVSGVMCKESIEYIRENGLYTS